MNYEREKNYDGKSRRELDRKIRITAIRDLTSPDLIKREFNWIMTPQFPAGLANEHP